MGPSTGTLPPASFPPGTVRYFSAGQEYRQELLQTVSCSSWTPHAGVRTHLGTNLYEKDRSVPPAASAAPAEAPAEIPLPPRPPVPPAEAAAVTAAAVGELNMLASLIGSQPVHHDDHFKLESLFSENVFNKAASAKGAEVIQIDGSSPSDYSASLDAVRAQMEGLNVAPPPPPADDDLLDLL